VFFEPKQNTPLIDRCEALPGQVPNSRFLDTGRSPTHRLPSLFGRLPPEFSAPPNKPMIVINGKACHKAIIINGKRSTDPSARRYF
jgi:hypothetical protein